jgi:DNA-binding response OmpR family regulator
MSEKNTYSRESQAGPNPAPRSLRILLADDDRDAAMTMMMVLRDEGHDVKAVYAGRSVMGMVMDFQPDAVILDIHMPDMSGWQVARTIREMRGQAPLLIGISGHYTTGADRILSELNGFDHYLLKPCLPSDLLKILQPLRDQSER